MFDFNQKKGQLNAHKTFLDPTSGQKDTGGDQL